MIKTYPYISAASKPPAVLPDTETRPETTVVTEEEHYPGEGYRVLLFNDDDHGMDEVTVQLVKALGCAIPVAVAIMAKAHLNGHAVVTITDQDEAERVAAILREINLRVAVEAV